VNAAVVALGIFASLAFEETGLDMVAFAVVALASVAVLRQSGRPGCACRSPSTPPRRSVLGW